MALAYFAAKISLTTAIDASLRNTSPTNGQMSRLNTFKCIYFQTAPLEVVAAHSLH